MAEPKTPEAPSPLGELSKKTFRTTANWVCPGASPAVVPPGTFVGEGTPYPVPLSMEPKPPKASSLVEAELPPDYGKPKEVEESVPSRERPSLTQPDPQRTKGKDK